MRSSMLMETLGEKVTLESIRAARTRIKHQIHKTPVLTSNYFNKMTGKKLYFKCENFQKTGAFKYRGALNTIKRLKEIRNPDFVATTHTTGNLGQGVAFAAREEDIKSIVLIPEIAPELKKRSIREYGAELRSVHPTPKGAKESIANLLDELDGRGEFLDHHPFLIEGHGTMALELMEQVPHLDAIISCCGTGSLVSGLAVAAKSTNPNIRIITAEPEIANTVQLSLQNKRMTPFNYYPNTIADGLRESIFETPWKYLQNNIDASLTATEEQIKIAMFLLLERMKILAEPSGAVSTAALLSENFQKVTDGCMNIAIIVSGGNMDLRKFQNKEYLPQN